jgi:hypothetical protein
MNKFTEKNQYAKLPSEKKYKGFEYRRMKRGENAIIYEQRWNGILIAFEVFKIRSHDAFTLAGREIPAAESWPGDNAFGVWAWSVKTFKRALERFNHLEMKTDEIQ